MTISLFSGDVAGAGASTPVTLELTTPQLAGALAARKPVPVTSGTLPTDGPLFVTLLSSVVILVGALTFLPALALGPIAEHLAR